MFQLLAYTAFPPTLSRGLFTPPAVAAVTEAAQPRRLYFTFRFFHFETTKTAAATVQSTPNTLAGEPADPLPALLVGAEGERGLVVRCSYFKTKQKLCSSLCILTCIPCWQASFLVEPKDVAADDAYRLARYLQTHTLQIDVWDADTQLHVGTSGVALHHCVRRGQAAVMTTLELQVCVLPFFFFFFSIEVSFVC